MATRPPVSIVVVAAGGYGFHYLRHLWDQIPSSDGRLVGVVDPEAERSAAWPEIRARGVPVFDDLTACFAAGVAADLVVVASPIQWHVPHSLAALAHGARVLCEKPVAATIQEVAELTRARDRAGRWVMIGYQWSFSTAIRALQRDIARGLYGAPRRVRTLCCWPRRLDYYRRNRWAGRRRDPDSGRWVLDSPANNAMAHFLHNALYLIGGQVGANGLGHGGGPARLAAIEAETYRAYPIETYDTVACRAWTAGATEVLFYASHATAGVVEPRFRIELDDATASFGETGTTIRVTDRRGRVIDYGSPEDTHQFYKLRIAIDAVHDPSLVVCPPEAAAAQTVAVNGIEESVASVARFPDDQCRLAGEDGVEVTGLESALDRCYQAGMLPSEAAVEWAVPGRRVDLTAYDGFPGGRSPAEETP